MFIAGASLVTSAALAQGEGERYEFQIRSQSLGGALEAFVTLTDAGLIYPQKLAEAADVNAVIGQYTIEEALDVLLEGTGFSGGLTKGGTIVVSLDKTKTQDREGTVNNGNIKKGLLASVSAFLFGAGVPGGAVAQDAEASGGYAVAQDTIIVTAQRREQSIQEVPMSIVGLNANELNARNVGNLVDLSVAVPGLVISDNDARRDIQMRGLGSVAGAPFVGVYTDEMPVTSLFSFSQIDTRLYDLERVEVLRGPQGTLYGNGSVAGTLRFITRKPELDAFSGGATIGVSHTQDGGVNHNSSGFVNVPIVNDVFGLRIAGEVDNSSGWIDQPAAKQKNINSEDMINLRIKGLFKPTDNTELASTVIVHRNDSGFSQSEDENGNFTQTFGLTTTPSLEDNYELYNVTGIAQFGDVEGMFSSSFRRSTREVSSEGRFFQFLPPPFPPFDVLIDDNSAREKAMSHEVRFNSIGEGRISWVVGAFYMDVELEDDSTVFFGLHAPGAPLPTPTIDQLSLASESWAVFGDVTIALTEGLEIGGGLRYFEDERKEEIGVQEASFDSLSPRAFLKYNMSDTITAYASVAKGFRSGGFNLPGQPVFNPDSLWTYEVGAKFGLPRIGVDGEVAAYFTDYTDFQILGVVPGTAGTIVSNGGDAEIRGIDARLGFQLAENFRFDASGTYVDSEVTALRVADSPFILGDPLDNVPEYSFALSSTYDFDVGNKPGSLRIDYSQRGETRWTNRSFGPHFIGRSGVNNMLNFDLGLSVTEHARISIVGENLLNDRDLIAATVLTGFAPRNRPRTVGLEFDLSLN